MLFVRRILVLVLAFSIGSSTAGADDATAQARDHYNKGSRAFSLGRFADAIKEYEAAFELRDDPVLLYNIAQAHRLNHNPERALFFYRSYLSRAPDAPNAGDVRQKISDMQKLVDEQRRAQKPAPTPAPPAAQPAPAPPPPATAPAPAPEFHVNRGQRIGGIALIGAGVALLATGITLSALVPGLDSDLRNTAAAGGVYDPSVQSRAKAFQVTGPVLDAVGVLAAAGGGALLYLSGRHHERVSVAPSVGPHSVGLSAQGAF
jgi:tetratricopeptide (TPR) repeat protein